MESLSIWRREVRSRQLRGQPPKKKMITGTFSMSWSIFAWSMVKTYGWKRAFSSLFFLDEHPFSVPYFCLPPCVHCVASYTHLRQVSTKWFLLNRWVFLFLQSIPTPVTILWTCFPPKASMARAHPCFTQDHHKASAFFRCRNLHKGSTALGHLHVPGTVNCSAQSSRQLSTRWVYPRPCDQGIWRWD